ncbi:MAG: hypothetical protein WD100_10260 [Tistlia sp.]|uniref:hypothetical protein n=1 Tax=Tistlia sp. TaxID=3057121 RepID=UPI0034A1F065
MTIQDDIRQRDLSGKTVREMDEQEKLEIKRRFDEFVELVKTRKVQVDAPTPPRQVAKWNPLAQGGRRS